VTYADGTECTKPALNAKSRLCKACIEWKRRNGGTDPNGRPLSPKGRGKGRKQCNIVEDGTRCPNPVSGNGMCLKHCKRVKRSGDPLKVRPKRGNGELLAACRAAAQGATDECILLTTAAGARMHVMLDGVHMHASRAVWILANGDPGDAHVLHTCNGGSGATGCINIRHLRIGDSAENAQDKVDAWRQVWGEEHHRHVLTEDQVREVLRRYKPRDPVNGGRALAAEFGVAPSTISVLVRGKTWPGIMRSSM
jgi:hypothetical protein